MRGATELSRRAGHERCAVPHPGLKWKLPLRLPEPANLDTWLPGRGHSQLEIPFEEA